VEKIYSFEPQMGSLWNHLFPENITIDL